MNRDYEALSAFLDGETNDLETRRVLRDLDQADTATLGRGPLAPATLRRHASREVPPAVHPPRPPAPPPSPTTQLFPTGPESP